MKSFLKTFLALALVLCLSVTTVYAGGEGDDYVEDSVQAWIDEGYPVVSRITDSCAANYAQLSTDQTGDYVSVYVQGYNIGMDTVKPVFYDDSGNVISGDVAAVEAVLTGYSKGTYFRIEKLESDAWNIENTGSVNSKYFTVKLEPVGDKEVKYQSEPFSEKVKIFRRDVYFTSFDNIRETLTLYFSTGVAADTNTLPQLEMGYKTYDSETKTYVTNVVKEAQATSITKTVNKFTGQQETKAVFSLAGFDYDTEFSNWYPQYTVTFKNLSTGEEEIFSSYDDYDLQSCVGRSSFFQETAEIASVSGNSDVILYYPYWIGGIYKLEDTGNQSKYFISEAEAEFLGAERFAYTDDYKKGNGNLNNGNFCYRQYDFAFFVADPPVKPTGIPKVSVQIDGDDYTLSWNKIEGASGYKIYAVSGDWSYPIYDTSDLTWTFSKYLLEELSAMGGESVQLKICTYVDHRGTTVEGDLSDAISLVPAEPKLNATKKSLNAGKTFKLSVSDANGEKVTFKSEKTSVATVNKTTGMVTALKNGTAKITATVGKKTLTCVITVKTTPQVKYNNKVAKNNKIISAKKGKTVKLTITGKADSIKNKVTTSKKSVAKITSNAKNSYVTVRAMKKGTATVKITINNVVTYKYTIKVK